MTLKPQVTFHNMETVPALEAAVGKEADGLDRFFDRITSCHIVIEQLRRQEAGGLYHVRVLLGVPGGELVADRYAALHDARRAVREAFREMRRQLQDYAQRLRGDTKRHEEASLGTVTESSPEEGSGFLEVDGRGGAQAGSVRLIRPTRQGRRSSTHAVLPSANREGAAS